MVILPIHVKVSSQTCKVLLGEENVSKSQIYLCNTETLQKVDGSDLLHLRVLLIGSLGFGAVDL
jgi:hypothetical protein